MLKVGINRELLKILNCGPSLYQILLRYSKQEIADGCDVHDAGKRWQTFSLNNWRDETSRRPRRRFDDTIKMDIGETDCGDVDWIHLDCSYEHGNKISESIESGEFFD